MATATKQRATKRTEAAADEPVRPLPGQTNFCELHGEGMPTLVRVKKEMELETCTIEAGAVLSVFGLSPTGSGLVVNLEDDGSAILQPGDFEVVERAMLASAERKPKRVQLVTAVTLHTPGGPKSIEPPEQFDVVEVHSKGVIIDVKKLGRWPIGQGEYKVIAWSDSPAPKSMSVAAAARAAKEPIKTNGKPHADVAASAKSTAAAETKRVSTPPGFGPERSLLVSDLVRHPKNRTPKPADVDAMAESLGTDGQLEPLLVREIDASRYQIVSGETRWLAAKKLKCASLACRVITCDDARALELLAICNAKRTDLDPIEKARMIVELCKPTADGGANLTREAAAKVYGLETGAGASNLIRLLELPKVWQERVASGELPQKFGRTLAAIAAAPKLLAEVEGDWKRAHAKNALPWHKEYWESHDAFEEFIDDIISRETYSLDPKAKHRTPGVAGEFPVLFELTPANRKAIGVATITIDGKPVEVATDCHAFDELQQPLAKEAAAKKSKGKASAAGADDDDKPEKPKPLTPAQRKAAAAEKQKKLGEYLAGWRHELLKRSIAFELRKSPANPKPVERAVVRKLFAALVYYGMGGHVPRMSSDLEDSEPKGISNRQSGSGIDGAYEFVSRVGVDSLDRWQQEAAASFIAEEDDDARRPMLPYELVDAIAAELSIDVADEWLALQVPGSRADRPRLENFLLMHNSEQLRAQAEEWGVHVADGKTKKVMVDIILGRAAPLKLPKSIKPLAAAAATKPSVKKGAKPR